MFQSEGQARAGVRDGHGSRCNGSGLASSDKEQRTDRNGYYLTLAQTAQQNGLECALSLVREIEDSEEDSVGEPVPASA